MALRRIQSVIITRSFCKLFYPPSHTSMVLGSVHRQSLVSCDSCLVHTSATVAAGHSKWSNIKHIKGARDSARAVVASQLARKIQLCLVRNPNTDPKLNSELASIIKQARQSNIPNDVLDKAIDRQIKLQDPKNIVTFAGRGPGNIGICLEVSSLKPHHTKSLLQSIVRKAAFDLNKPGDDLFTHTGLIEVAVPEEDEASAVADPENFNVDKYVDVAIEAGAEDVTLEPGEQKPYLQFVSHPNELSKVSKALTEAGLTVNHAEKTYLPNASIPASPEFMELVEKVLVKVEEHPDIIKFYHNVVPEEAS